MSLTPVEEVFNSPPCSVGYPRWITRNKIFKKHSNIRKVFPEIGLKNDIEDHKASSVEAFDKAKELFNSIRLEVVARASRLKNFLYSAKKISEERKSKIMNLSGSLNNIYLHWSCIPFTDVICLTKSGTLELRSGLNYKDNASGLSCKQEMSLFKLYGQISNILKKLKCLPLRPLEELKGFKEFSSLNKPSENIKIVFSCDGKDGIWDIATMSMRGISSCQTWNSDGSGQACRVIGSIVDPYTAIIYLTREKSTTSYGSSMIRRCVVRYVMGRDGKERVLLEKMYPSYDKDTEKAFINFLSKRTPLQVISLHSPTGSFYNHLIPIADEMKVLQTKYYPYVDSRFPYLQWESPRNSNYESLFLDFAKKAKKLFVKAIRSNAFSNKRQKEIDSDFSKPESEWISVMRGRGCDEPPVLKIAEKYLSLLQEKFPDRNPLKNHLFLDEQIQTELSSFLTESFSFRPGFAKNVTSGIIRYLEDNLSA